MYDLYTVDALEFYLGFGPEIDGLIGDGDSDGSDSDGSEGGKKAKKPKGGEKPAGKDGEEKKEECKQQ